MAEPFHGHALRGVQAGIAWAAEQHLRVGIVVLDARFTPVLAVTLDGAYPSAFKLARAKAHTALNFGAATVDLAARLKPENMRAVAAAEPRFLFVGGGVPIRAGERVLGAIGVSGASEAQDGDCAEHILAATDWTS